MQLFQLKLFVFSQKWHWLEQHTMIILKTSQNSHHVCFMWQTLNGNIIIISCKIIPFRARVNSSSISTQNVLSGKWQHPLECLPSSVKYLSSNLRLEIIWLTSPARKREANLLLSFSFALLKNVSIFYFWATKSEAINFIMRGTHITIFLSTTKPQQDLSLTSAKEGASSPRAPMHQIISVFTPPFLKKKKVHRRCQTTARMYTKLDSKATPNINWNYWNLL